MRNGSEVISYLSLAVPVVFVSDKKAPGINRELFSESEGLKELFSLLLAPSGRVRLLP